MESSQCSRQNGINIRPLTMNVRGGIFKKKRAPAGCVPIAIAQIMAHNEVPRTTSWNGYSCSWAELKSFDPGKTPVSSRDEYIRKTAAFFLSNIGAHCNTIYSKGWGFTLPSRAKNFLASFYRNVEIFHNNYREDKVLEMLFAHKPVFIAAVSGCVNGHAWLIDGVEIWTREKYTLDPITQQKNLVAIENETRVNCNWGWRFSSKVTSGVFKVKGEHYDWLYRIITYDL